MTAFILSSPIHLSHFLSTESVGSELDPNNAALITVSDTLGRALMSMSEWVILGLEIHIMGAMVTDEHTA